MFLIIVDIVVCVSVYCSGDRVNTGDQLSASGGLPGDELNVTRLCTGSDSDFMEMTACLGGLMADSTVVEPDPVILSPTFEQENNIYHAEHEAALVDAHNKSVFYENDSDDRDMSLTSGGHGGIISLESAPSTTVSAGDAVSDGRALNKTVLYDGADMEMTQCVSHNTLVSVVGEDTELTQYMPSDTSSSFIKSTSRWPFGKRQDGTRDRISRYEDNATSESLSLDRKPFANLDDMDVTESLDTLEFLTELNREIGLAPDREHNPPLPISSACFPPLSFPASTTCLPVVSASTADGKATDMTTHSVSVDEQGSESLPKKIMDCDDGEISCKPMQLVNNRSSSAPVAAAGSGSVEADMSIVASSALSTSLTSTVLVKAAVMQHEQGTTSFLTQAPAEASIVQSAPSYSSTSMLLATALAYPTSSETALPVFDVSLPVPDVLSQVDGYRDQTEISLNELQKHFPQETWKLGDISSSFKHGADVVESIFAAKDPAEVLTSTSMVVENVSLATSAVDSTLTEKQVKTSELQHLENAAVTNVAETGFLGLQVSTASKPIVGIQAETEIQKPLRNVAQSSQSADDLLTRMKLASSMPQHSTAEGREGSATTGIGRGFHPANPAPKQNPAYQRSGKPVSTATAFQRYARDLDRTKELSRLKNISEIAANTSSRMDLSALPIDRTENMSHSLVSVSITDNLDATKREEVSLKPIRDVMLDTPGIDISAWHIDETETLTSVSIAENRLEPLRDVTQLSSSCAVDRMENLETSAVTNMELSSSAKPPSKFSSTFSEPVIRVSSKLSKPNLSSSCTGGEVYNMETSAATNMELSLSAKPDSKLSSTFMVSAMPVASAFETLQSYLSTSHIGGGTENLKTSVAPNVELSLSAEPDSKLSSTFLVPAMPVASASKTSQFHLSTSRISGGMENLESSAAVNMELSLSAKWHSQFSSTFTIPAVPVISEGLESNLSSSCTGGEADNLETSAVTDIVLLSSLGKPCLKSGSTFSVPVTSVSSESATFCLPVAATTANILGSITSEHRPNDQLTDVNSVRLLSETISSHDVNVGIDEGQSQSTEPSLMAAKSSAESGEEYLSLLGAEVSQSSVFSSAAAEAAPVNYVGALSADAQSLPAVSTNQVHGQSL